MCLPLFTCVAWCCWGCWRLYLGHAAPKLLQVWLWLFKWTSRLQTGHKRLRFIQSLIIEIPCKRLLSALNMWFLMSAVSRRWATVAAATFFFFFFLLHLFVGNRGRRRSSFTSFRRCRITEAENHHANPVIWPRVRGSGSRLSTNPPLMDICFTSCAAGQILPLLRCTAWLIFRVSELRIVVLPHRNKQMAARSWVITKPLPEWLVLGPGRLDPRPTARPCVCSGS